MRSKRTKRLKHKSKILKTVLLFILLTIILIISDIRPTTADSNTSDGDYNTLNISWSRTNEGRKVYANFDNNGVMEKSTTKNPGVLITDALLKNNSFKAFDYNTLFGKDGLIVPNVADNVWDGKGNNKFYNEYVKSISKDNLKYYSEFATWEHKGINNIQESWRAFKGKFSYDKNDAENEGKEVYIGVRNKDNQLILPVNDNIVILIDGKVTKMNFSTEINCEKSNFYMNNGTSQEKMDFKFAYYDGSKNWGQPEKHRCNNDAHNNASLHTDTWHAHLDDIRDGSNLRLGDIKDYLSDSKEHKIEILSSDFMGGGGMSELQIYTTEEPDYSLSKEGYVVYKEEKEVDLGDNDEDTKIYQGDNIYYRFIVRNNKNKDNKNANLTFTDEDLGVQISKLGVKIDYNKNGIYEVNEEVPDYSSLRITVDGKTTEGKIGLTFLDTLKGSSTIKVEFKDVLKHTINKEDEENKEFKNTVKSSLHYLGGGLEDKKESSFTVKVKEQPFNISVEKEIFKYIRSGREMNNITDETLYIPGDEVFFKIKIANNSKTKISNLKLTDTLVNNVLSYEKNQVIKDKWNYILPINFNKDSFEIPEESFIEIVTSYIVEEPAPIAEAYDLTNIVKVERNEGEVEEASKVFSIERPSISIRKVLEENLLDDKDRNRTFSIKVSDDSNSLFGIEAKVDEVYSIKNLFYGKEYTISETIPMNYADFCIGVESDNYRDNTLLLKEGTKYKLISNKFIITNDNTKGNRINNKKLLNVINKKVNDKFFYDYDTIINKITLGGAE